MPEGDSVHRLAARLRAALDGATVVDGELRGGAAAGARLSGARIREHDTHGKHLLTRFDDGRSLHTHLRMQGSWSLVRDGRTPPVAVRRAARVRMSTDAGVTAWGIDLPVVELLDTRDEARVVGHLGPDPLRDDWDPDAALGRLRAAAARPLVAALLDQRIVAGFGNLWANELCFLVGVSPFSPVGGAPLERLVALGARALRTSATVPGMFQVTTGIARRDSRHWVVGRAGRPCLRCGATVRVRAETPGDPEHRRTWWCPSCQPGAP